MIAAIVYEFIAAERLQAHRLVVCKINKTAVYYVVTVAFAIFTAAKRVAFVAAMCGYDTARYINVFCLTVCAGADCAAVRVSIVSIVGYNSVDNTTGNINVVNVAALPAADGCAKDAFCVDYTAVDGNIVCLSVITAADACALAAFCIDSAAVYDNVACGSVIIAADSRRVVRACRIKSAAAAAADMAGFSAVLAGYGERSALVTV